RRPCRGTSQLAGGFGGTLGRSPGGGTMGGGGSPPFRGSWWSWWSSDQLLQLCLDVGGPEVLEVLGGLLGGAEVLEVLGDVRGGLLGVAAGDRLSAGLGPRGRDGGDLLAEGRALLGGAGKRRRGGAWLRAQPEVRAAAEGVL